MANEKKSEFIEKNFLDRFGNFIDIPSILDCDIKELNDPQILQLKLIKKYANKKLDNTIFGIYNLLNHPEKIEKYIKYYNKILNSIDFYDENNNFIDYLKCYPFLEDLEESQLMQIQTEIPIKVFKIFINPLRKNAYLKLRKKKKNFCNLKEHYTRIKSELNIKTLDFDWSRFSKEKLANFLSFYLQLKVKKEETLIPELIPLNKEIEKLYSLLKQNNELEIEKQYMRKVNEQNQILFANSNLLFSNEEYVLLTKTINDITFVLEEKEKYYGRK